MKHTQPEPRPRPADGVQTPQGLQLRHLRYFMAVADAGSFTHAAERIFIAQATLSQQIRRLEQIVGTPLLHRRREGLRLTTAGGILLDASRNVLSLVDHEVSRTRQAAGLGRPRLRMVIPPGLPEDLAVKTTAALRAAAAAADMNVTWLETALDVGWLTTSPDAVPAPLEVMILGEFEPDLWIPASHPAARRGSISLDELASINVIFGLAGAGDKKRSSCRTCAASLPLPVLAADRGAAGWRSAPAVHHAVVVIEQGVVGGQLLAGDDVAHGGQDGVTREAHVRFAGMIDEEHDRLVLCVLDGGQVKAAGAPANPPDGDDPVSTTGVPLA